MVGTVQQPCPPRQLDGKTVVIALKFWKISTDNRKVNLQNNKNERFPNNKTLPFNSQY